MNDYIIIAYYVMWYLLVFTAICFFVSGVDDLFFDAYYWGLEIWRTYKFRNKKKLTYGTLAMLPEKRIAVMVPCWHEAGVIEFMLQHNVYGLDYSLYDLFVGVYPNDPATIEAVSNVAKTIPHVQCVIGPDPGPTNKARNLNSIYTYIMEYEKKNNIQYDIFVMQDSEDIIHPLSFKLYNYLIPKKDMVQIPVFPLEISLWHLTHWTYAAEFCETHSKDAIVREMIGGLVPSAGVGTAFSRSALDILKLDHAGVPFGTSTLTEDYSTALQIRLHGLKPIFVLQYVYRTVWRKKWYFFGSIEPVQAREYIATRALFPMKYSLAVRQKARWVLGISFQEWIHSGWQGNLPTLYTLAHDRKALFTHLVSGLFFILIPFWGLYIASTAYNPDYPTLQDRFDQSPWVWYAIMIASALMTGRFFQRMIAVFRIYGFWPALLSGPLILYGNVINLHALLRAYSLFFFTPKAKGGGGGSTARWDKTDHEFPARHLFTASKKKLGEMLIEEKILTKDTLIKVLNEQSQTGEQLGQILVRLHYITPKQLIEIFSKQYHLPLISKSTALALPFDKISHISRYGYHYLLSNECLPIAIEDNTITLAISDPSNELRLTRAIELIRPYEAKFVLVNPAA
ncbi:MAG: glycosyltransferase [Gammaproteobacteria bacterium]|jgi:adsorption protein B|nr:glycosyltransferase [Gammaproteobacteria bacterium]